MNHCIQGVEETRDVNLKLVYDTYPHVGTSFCPWFKNMVVQSLKSLRILLKDERFPGLCVQSIYSFSQKIIFIFRVYMILSGGF